MSRKRRQHQVMPTSQCLREKRWDKPLALGNINRFKGLGEIVDEDVPRLIQRSLYVENHSRSGNATWRQKNGTWFCFRADSTVAFWVLGKEPAAAKQALARNGFSWNWAPKTTCDASPSASSFKPTKTATQDYQRSFSPRKSTASPPSAKPENATSGVTASAPPDHPFNSGNQLSPDAVDRNQIVTTLGMRTGTALPTTTRMNPGKSKQAGSVDKSQGHADRQEPATPQHPGTPPEAARPDPVAQAPTD